MIAKLKKLISLAKNIHFQSLIGNGMMAVFGLITNSILYRSLPVSELGVYIFFLAISGLIDTLRAGFLSITFIKFYSGTEKERADQVAGSAWFIGLFITGMSVLVNIPTYFIAGYVQDPGLNLFLKYFSIISVITLPSFMANCVVLAEKRFDRFLWLRIFTQGSFTLCVFALAFLKDLSLNVVLITYAVSNLFASLVVLILKWTKVHTLRKTHKATVMELFHFGKYSMGTNIGSNLFNVTSTFVINFFLGPAALAIANVGGKLTQIIEIPLLSFASSGMSILSADYNQGNHTKVMYTLKKLVGMMTIAIIPVTVVSVIFAEPIIYLLGGKNYVNTEAPNIFRLFMVIALMYPADRFFSLALDVIDKPKINFYKIIVMLIVNLVAVLIGISLYHSIYSISIASIFPTAVAILMTYYPLNKYSKFNFWNIYVIGYRELVLLIKQLVKGPKEKVH
jgi:O-antigen/teichoic acid export membrane protein